MAAVFLFPRGLNGEFRRILSFLNDTYWQSRTPAVPNERHPRREIMGPTAALSGMLTYQYLSKPKRHLLGAAGMCGVLLVPDANATSTAAKKRSKSYFVQR
jgi:hypothetical protein